MENIHYNTYEQATNILLSGKHIEFTMSVPNVRDGHFAQKLEMLSKCPFSHFHIFTLQWMQNVLTSI